MTRRGSRLVAVAEEPAARTVRLPFDADTPASFVEAVQREIRRGALAAVTVDLGRTDHVDPTALGALAAAVALLRSTGASLHCTGARPAVYKALHVAKLATSITRAPHGATSTAPAEPDAGPPQREDTYGAV